MKNHFPSNPVYYLIGLNIIFGFYINLAVMNRGCRLPNGYEVSNGWSSLYNNCQEKCVCQRNKLKCLPNSCDLDKNKCVTDSVGDAYCQGAMLVLNSWIRNKAMLIDLNGNSGTFSISHHIEIIQEHWLKALIFNSARTHTHRMVVERHWWDSFGILVAATVDITDLRDRFCTQKFSISYRNIL